MRVIFIHHSCFVVELDEKVLIFDWFAGDRVEGYTFRGTLPEYEADTPVYVFASHKHRDHFDMDVLHLAEKYRNIHFIFSKDCKMTGGFLKRHGFPADITEKITYVGANAKYRVGDLNIETLRSTDAGVAFYVESHGISCFHAGDLNDWKWDGAGELVMVIWSGAFIHRLRCCATRRFILHFSRWIQDRESISSSALTILCSRRMPTISSRCTCGRIIPGLQSTREESATRRWQSGLWICTTRISWFQLMCSKISYLTIGNQLRYT